MRTGVNRFGAYRHICPDGFGGALMTELKKWASCLLLITALCLACYHLGRSHAEVKIIKEQGKEIIKEVEVIKYVEKEKAKIWSAPAAGRDNLLELMRAGKL